MNANVFSTLIDSLSTPEKWFALGVVIAALHLDGVEHAEIYETVKAHGLPGLPGSRDGGAKAT